MRDSLRAGRSDVRNQHPIIDRWAIQRDCWVHGGNRPHPVEFGNLLTNRWSALAFAFMQNGIPRIELDTHFNPGKIHSNMHWPDNEIIVPKKCHWMAKEWIVDDIAEYIRGPLAGIALPLPLCSANIGVLDEALPATVQAHRLITGVNNCKQGQHPQRLREVVDLTIYDRMWWIRELFRVCGGVGVQFVGARG